MNIRFDEKTHTYYLDNRIIPSVTEIIGKVMGNPFARDTLAMRQARDKGTLIHNTINKFVVNNEEPSFPMIEFDNFIKLSNKYNLIWDMSERIIYNNIGGKEYAGTLDLYDAENKEITDVKTGSVKAIKKWQIQLSLYAEGLRREGYIVERSSILWLHDEIDEYIPINLLSKDYISDFLTKYYSPNINNQEEEKTLKCLNSVALEEFGKTLDTIDVLEKQIKDVKKQILSEMEERQITQIRLGNRVISYVAPTTKISLDSKRIKECYPAVYSDCQKESAVSASIRISKKAEEK